MAALPEPIHLQGLPLDRRQVLALDGISFACRMLVRSYTSLTEALLVEGSDGVDALLNAWAVVDHSHRLVSLLGGTPGMKQKGTPVATAISVLKGAEPFRNAIQHMGHGELQRTAAEIGGSIWGHIYWVHKTDDQHKMRMMLTGTLDPRGGGMTVPAPTPELLASASNGPCFVHLVRVPDLLSLDDLVAAAVDVYAAIQTEVQRRLREQGSGLAAGQTLRLTWRT